MNSPSVPAGSIVEVCPGSYDEQVIISKPLTLQGIASQGQHSVQITGAFQPITTTSAVFSGTSPFNQTIAPAVWVTAGPVNIQNIAILQERHVICPALSVGIYYASGASGTLNHVATYGSQTDQQLCAVGIWAENADASSTTVTIQNSFAAFGIVAGSLQPAHVIPVLTVNVTGNQIFQTKTNISTYGVYLYQLFATVNTNFITGPSYSDANGGTFANDFVGIMNDGAIGTTITNNTLVFNNYTGFGGNLDPIGIASTTAGLTIKSNKIFGATVGMFLSCGSGNVVSGNTINSADYGIFGMPIGAIGNKFYHVTVGFQSC